MGNALKVIFLFLLIGGGAYLSGVRVHPEVLRASVPVPSISSKKGVELVFKNGQRATGQIVKEIPGGILFNMEGAEISFTNDEIASRTEVTVPSSAPVNYAKQNTFFITYDPSRSIFRQMMGKAPEKKPAFQASSLWSSQSRSTGAGSGIKAANSNSMAGIYQKSMSKESLDAWKNDALAQMGQGRNPFVEARNAARDKASAADTSRSESKLKELQESGY